MAQAHLPHPLVSSMLAQLESVFNEYKSTKQFLLGEIEECVNQVYPSLVQLLERLVEIQKHVDTELSGGARGLIIDAKMTFYVINVREMEVSRQEKHVNYISFERGSMKVNGWSAEYVAITTSWYNYVVVHKHEGKFDGYAPPVIPSYTYDALRFAIKYPVLAKAGAMLFLLDQGNWAVILNAIARAARRRLENLETLRNMVRQLVQQLSTLREAGGRIEALKEAIEEGVELP